MATNKPRVRLIDGKYVPVSTPVVLKPRPRRSGPTSRMPTLEQFMAAQKEHRTLKEIAKHFKCSYVQVQRWHRTLFPDGNMRSGPACRYEVVQIDVTGPADISVYSVKDQTRPAVPAVDVWWDGTAHCTVCIAPGVRPNRAGATRCGHARTVRSRIEAVREKDHEGS